MRRKQKTRVPPGKNRRQKDEIEQAIELHPHRPVWGARGIAAVINKSVGSTNHLLARGRLDADKRFGTWSSTPARLLAGFARPAADRS